MVNKSVQLDRLTLQPLHGVRSYGSARPEALVSTGIYCHGTATLNYHFVVCNCLVYHSYPASHKNKRPVWVSNAQSVSKKKFLITHDPAKSKRISLLALDNGFSFHYHFPYSGYLGRITVPDPRLPFRYTFIAPNSSSTTLEFYSLYSPELPLYICCFVEGSFDWLIDWLTVASLIYIDMADPENIPLRFVLEGGVGCGKTSLIHHLESHLHPGWQYFLEPLDRWKNFNGIDYLDRFYHNPTAPGYCKDLESVVITSYRELMQRDVKGPVQIYERSAYSAMTIFCPANVDKGYLSAEDMGELQAQYRDDILPLGPFQVMFFKYLHVCNFSFFHYVIIQR